MSLLAVQTLTSILIRVNPNDESSLRTLKLVSKDFRKAIQRICGMLLSVYASLEMELRCMFETAHDVHKHFEDDGKNKQAQFEDTEHKLLIYFTYAHGTTKVLYTAANDQSHFMRKLLIEFSLCIWSNVRIHHGSGDSSCTSQSEN